MTKKEKLGMFGKYFGVKWLLLTIAILVISGLALGWAMDLGTAEATRVAAGVSVPGRDLSNVEREQGIAILKDLEEVMGEWTVYLRLDDVTWQARPGELGFSLAAERTMDRALAVREQLNALQRLQSHFYPVHRQLELDVDIDDDILNNYLAGITADIISEPVDATFVINEDDTVTVIPGQPGRRLVVEQVKERLILNLSQGQVPEVQLELEVVPPTVNEAQVRGLGLEGLVAKASTTFKEPGGPRAHNIRNAAARLDGLLLAPGQALSFNETVGPRTGERGYRMAPVIIGNKFDEGMGGGICQVSSTAYKAALLAGMAVVERHNHSLTVSYIDLGLDAAVVYGMLDLKLRNDSEAHVLLKTSVDGSLLTVKIFGTVIPDRKISLASAVIEVFEPEELRVVDPELLAGVEEVTEKGARGYKVTTKRIVVEGGTTVTTEQLPSSYYRSINRVITVGEQVAEEPLNNSHQDEPVE